MAEFVHLHVHSEFSMLHSAIRIPALVERVKELGMDAVAITDHVNLYGTLAFHKQAHAAGIKPIVGCELSVEAPPDQKGLGQALHLVALAESQEGYRNLLALSSKAWLRADGPKLPALPIEALGEHREGLIFLSACMGGYVAQSALYFGEEGARTALNTLLTQIQEPKNLFVELQDHGFKEQRPLNRLLVRAAKSLGLGLVATQDCHFLRPEDAAAQRALQCIHGGQRLEDMEDEDPGFSRLYLATPEEMTERFAELPEAIENTRRISERCAGKVTPTAAPQLPSFTSDAGEGEGQLLRRLAADGLQERLAELEALGEKRDAEEYNARLQHELDVIEGMGFPGYFLIVQDFINWAKSHQIPVGPGRGSGAGSIVAYVLRITDLDPIFHGLLFERFLNPERVSMPDFDVDFCVEGRDRVINYVRERYGTQAVAQIATFHQLKSKSVVRDVGRVMGMAPADAGKVASLIPEPVQGKIVSIAKALDQEPRLRALVDSDPQIATLIETAQSLEDLTRHAGMHAAGVVIAPGILWDFVPVFCPEPGTLVTQFHKDDVEDAGLVKFDFLGLKTLTVIDIALGLVNQRPDRQEMPLDLARIPMDDSRTFDLLRSGETKNVFQLESQGMQALFKQLKPDAFEDIVAAVALYRPGPLGSGMVEDFIKRKHGLTPVAYPHPDLEATLRDTYGVIVYQEQVMKIAQVMGGYSLGAADLLRRAMGKKKPEEMAKQKAIFLAGAKEKGYREEDADRIFELMAYFAGYGFNKSHSAAYALITYQTAYLKAHYPVEFMCATMTSDRDKQDKVVRTVHEAKAMGLSVLPPDVNQSAVNFSVSYPETEQADALGEIRFGLGAVKGVGDAAVEAIFEARTEEAGPRPFADLFDFCERVDLRRVNKHVIESLVQCGAFDSSHRELEVHRAQSFTAIDKALELGKKRQSERQSGQTSLFDAPMDDDDALQGMMPVASAATRASRFTPAAAWRWGEQLKRERDTLGFFVSGHPLSIFEEDARRLGVCALSSLSGMSDGTRVTVSGVVEGFRERTTRSGSKVAFATLEDTSGRCELVIRSRALKDETLRERLKQPAPLCIKGVVQVNARDGEAEAEAPRGVVLQQAEPLSDALASLTRAVRVIAQRDAVDADALQALRTACEASEGQLPVQLRLALDEGVMVDMDLSATLKVAADDRFVESLRGLGAAFQLERMAELPASTRRSA